MSKNKVVTVQGHQISLSMINDANFVSLSDMAKDFGGSDQIKNWIRTRRTIEYLGTWEVINNQNFNMVEFHHVMNEAGSEKFIMSPTQWAERTNAIGIIAKSGRFGGGTFAHEDIALEFGSWLSPQFRLYLMTEFKRLKEIESHSYNLEWNVKRVISKINYRLHTDSIKENIIPKLNIHKSKEWLVYASEADILNVALFGCTAKDWEQSNPKSVLEGKNIRDFASINELAVLSNIESLNSIMIKEGISKKDRFNKLLEVSTSQLKALHGENFIKSLKHTSDSTYPIALVEHKKPLSNFDKNLKGLLAVPPPPKKNEENK